MIAATYASIHKQQVHAELVGLLLHVPCEADEVTPVGTIILYKISRIHAYSDTHDLTCSLM